MKDNKLHGKNVKFEITASKKDLILDARGNPTVGYVIHYITERGSPGYIEIPEKEYTKEKALAKIEAEAEKLEELF